MTSTIAFILIISFIASLIRSTLGFGESLVAVPLFLLFLPIEIAVPLSVMMSIIIALVIVIQDHKEIHFESAKWLIIYAIPGIPIGILILTYGNEIIIKMGLGALIILYSLYSLLSKNSKILKEDNKWWLFACGFLSGVFGGAYGLNGPPLVVYGNLKQWSAKHFRATLQAYFLPVSFISVIGYYAKGLITTEVNIYFIISLTTVIPAVFLGRYLNHQLKNNSFFKYVYVGLILIGIILIVTSLI
ncbi:sulfite exporter TauE/SafE family protein [Pedobacter changchengzhani]|uniref:Probable membrane transporter protein n=1 Tax=Pedobacter changchengzhani TaxID=2529274 RepID=A0A4R5MQB7_9SPHI|nr:sulfite exporter TauE/SafE family protein [Pedobacter changchengzhani]TDG37846.1 sulfite exporter TauE/SafE family protein [Pedobacter changchengzhani]